MNGYEWRIQFVDKNSSKLVDRTGKHTVATTDPKTKCVYLSKELYGDFLARVLIHELGHCAIVSFGLIFDIRRMVRPEYWIEAEEWICNFIADYGLTIFSIAYSELGYDAIRYIPQAVERFVA